ncbi:MAG TPA: ribosome maturation factor RimM [Acidimicrobiales bacterium]|nr:ribosome maturation factor RimM [Acidimicrobiales bacterium]
MGRITKSHGVKGDVLVALSSDRTSRLDPGSVLSTDRGDLTVVRSSRHQDRWIVQFREIAGRDEADTWRGTLLRAEPIDDDDDEGALWVHELVGATVVLTDGTEVGRVEEVQANPASDLLVLDSGALVPVVFVTDQAPGRITIDPPEGLLDLAEG